jgi:hypothetical protein
MSTSIAWEAPKNRRRDGESVRVQPSGGDPEGS